MISKERAIKLLNRRAFILSKGNILSEEEAAAFTMAINALENSKAFPNKYNIGDIVKFEKVEYLSGTTFVFVGKIIGIRFNDIGEIMYDVDYKQNGEHDQCVVIEDAIREVIILKIQLCT